MKKKISLLLAVILVLSMCSLGISAACIEHGTKFITTYCSGNTSNVNVVSCHWAGKTGGGAYHGVNCQIVQVSCYTYERCTSCTHNVGVGSHMCYANHTQASMHVDLCPY